MPNETALGYKKGTAKQSRINRISESHFIKTTGKNKD